MVASPDVAAPALPPDPEGRLRELARAGAPLRRVVAALAGRVVAKKSWQRLGYARLGDYARERLGLSARSLQEFARVDAALAELPGLEAALVSGRLPWSKVRVLARFVCAGDEDRWIAFAERTGVRGLERACRAVDRGAAPGSDEEGVSTEPVAWVRVRVPLSLAFKWRRTQEAASKGAGERLSAGDVLERVAAEAFSGLPDGVMEAAGAADEGMQADRSCPRPLDAAPCPPCLPAAGGPPAPVALPRFLQPLLAGLPQADAFELDARLRRAVRLEQRLDAEIAPLLRHVTSAEYEWRTRYRSVAAYARERLGMSPRKARALLRLERVADVCPALRAAYRDGRLSWLQAQALAPLLLVDAEGGWREAWVAWAGRVTLRRLEAGVDHALWLRDAEPRVWAEEREAPERIDARLGEDPADPAPAERQVCAQSTGWFGDVPLRIRAEPAVARLFRAVLCRVRLVLERETGGLPSEAEAFEAMLDHAIESWGVDDRWLRRHRVFELGTREGRPPLARYRSGDRVA